MMRGYKVVDANYQDFSPWAGTREYRIGESYEGIEKEADGMWDEAWDDIVSSDEKIEMLGHLFFESIEEDIYAEKVRFLEVEGYGKIVDFGMGFKAENLKALREIPQDKIRKLLRYKHSMG